MKECVYGWYPPARDIWKTYRQPQSYDFESLYKHQDSRYNDRPGVPTPVVPTPLRATPQRRSVRSSRAGSRPATHTPQTDGLRIESVAAELHQERMCEGTPMHRAKSQTPLSVSQSPVKMFSPAPPKSRASSTQSPKKAWATNLPETQVSLPSGQSPGPHITKAGAPISLSPQVGTTQRPPSIPRPPSTTPHPPDSRASARPSRIQSATTSRARVTPPARPAKSAGSVRSAPVCVEPELLQGPVVSVRPDPPPPSPGPILEEEDEVLGVENPLDYDTQLEKNGWRMEIPGDPLNMKKPCIQKRLPYTCKLEQPKIKPNPPTAKMENWETFFYNTIPRRPATFTIHKEWISEVLHAKRMELQKRDGEESYKYRHTNFSFVY